MNPLVIGVGNRLRQDDGMGCRAVELLAARIPAAEFLECHQLTPELAPALAGRFIIFLDAAADREPGSVHSRRIDPERHTFSHHLSPGGLLELATVVNGAVSPAFLVTGGVHEAGLGDTLTPEGERCAQRMADFAEEIMGHAGSDALTEPSSTASAGRLTR